MANPARCEHRAGFEIVRATRSLGNAFLSAEQISTNPGSNKFGSTHFLDLQPSLMLNFPSIMPLPLLAFELTPAVQVASVLGLGIAAQWVAWKLRLPAIVLLLVFGVALGRFLPAEELGANQDLFFALVSLAVGVILFEGGLSLDFREIHGTKGVVARLVSIGLVITWLSTAAAAYYLGIFSAPMSVLLGALLTVSGPTVVLPLLRHVQPVRRIGSLAKWEGIVNDPIGAVLAALVFEVVLHQAEQGNLATGEVLINMGMTLFWGITLARGSCGKSCDVTLCQTICKIRSSWRL